MRYNLLKRWDRGRQLRRPRLFRHLGRSSLAEARGLATVANVSANMQHIGSGAIAFGFGEQCVHSALVWARWPDVTYNRNARAPVMAGVKVTCVCGAIYEVIETKGPSREARPFKCVLCDRELFAWDGDNVGQLHLVWRPDEDRE